MRIAIIGPGSVGVTLGRAWIKHGDGMVYTSIAVEGAQLWRILGKCHRVQY